MLQRIQSIWLLLAAACAFLTLKFSVYSGLRPNETQLHYLNGTETIIMIAVTVAIGTISLINIFLYHNRKLQLRLCILAIVIELLLIFLYSRQIKTFSGVGAYSLSSLLHIAVIVFLVLAANGVNSDEKLIKESNRLR